MSEAWLGPRAVATAAGVSPDTLRHYERLGLLAAPVRTRSGYRRYPPATVERVRVVRRALMIGFSLKELAGVLRQREHGAPPCRRVRTLVGERLADVNARLAELTVLRDQMQLLLSDWDVRLAATPDGERARLLDMLAGRDALAPRARRTRRIESR
jgi:MerR family transcriptional regulator, Zn(II)-responsive regulator of zntA